MKRRALAADEPPSKTQSPTSRVKPEQSQDGPTRQAGAPGHNHLTSWLTSPVAWATPARRKRPGIEIEPLPRTLLGTDGDPCQIQPSFPPPHRHAAAPLSDSKRPLRTKREIEQKGASSRRPARKGSGRALRALACRGGGGQPWHPRLRRSPKTNGEPNDDHPRIACLRAARRRSADLQLQPIGPGTGPSAVYLDLRDFLALSSILDPALARDKPVELASSCARPSCRRVGPGNFTPSLSQIRT